MSSDRMHEDQPSQTLQENEEKRSEMSSKENLHLEEVQDEQRIQSSQNNQQIFGQEGQQSQDTVFQNERPSTSAVCETESAKARRVLFRLCFLSIDRSSVTRKRACKRAPEQSHHITSSPYKKLLLEKKSQRQGHSNRVANRPGMPGTVPELTSDVPCPEPDHVCPGIY